MNGKDRNEKQLHPYGGTGFFYRIPVWIKTGVMKWWCAGAVYFFMGFGSPPSLQGTLVNIIGIGLVLGLVYQYIIAPVVRDMTRIPYEVNYFLAVRKRGPLGTVSNLLIHTLLIVGVVYTYEILNILGNMMAGTEQPVVIIPAEPILFGLLYLALETVWRRVFSPGIKGSRKG